MTRGLQLTTAAAGIVATDTPDLLPGVELDVEQIAPGVFLVTGDGYRGVRGRDMTVSAEGDVWLLRGGIGDWSVVRLGQSGTTLHLKDGKNRRLSLGQGRRGEPIVESWLIGEGVRARAFDGTGWTTTNAREPGCPDDAGPGLTLMPDGTCWGAGNNRYQDGRWTGFPAAELGLADGEGVDAGTVGPDGTGWVSVRSSSDANSWPTRFEGLQRYDGSTWTRVAYSPPQPSSDRPALTSDLAVAPDGTVWVVELSLENPGSVTVRSWDGASWSSYGPITRPPYPTSVGTTEPRGTHFSADGTSWFMDGWLYFDGESLHPFDLDAVRPLRYERPTSRSKKGFDPRGNIWVLAPDRKLFVITPEAVATTE